MTRDAQSTYVERMGSALNDAGLARLPSRVFAALTIDDDGRMTAAELAETLQVSPAAVSGAVKVLTRVNFIHRERDLGSRRDVYVVDDDAWHHAMRPDQAYGPLIVVLESALAELPADAPARHRLVLMREFPPFVSDEVAKMGPRWERRRRALERELSR